MITRKANPEDSLAKWRTDDAIVALLSEPAHNSGLVESVMAKGNEDHTNFRGGGTTIAKRDLFSRPLSSLHPLVSSRYAKH